MQDRDVSTSAHRAPANRRLRPWREFRGWSLRDLEARSGIPYGRIGQYERGEIAMPFEAAEQLAAALGIHVAYLWDVMMPDVPAREVHAPVPPTPHESRGAEGRGA